MRINFRYVTVALSTVALGATIASAGFTQNGSTAALLASRATAAAPAGAPPPPPPPPPPPAPQPVSDPTGTFTTVAVNGLPPQGNPFNTPLGTNGRACSTCHEPNEGWTITPTSIMARFVQTNGNDPLFRTVDGSNSPDDDPTTLDEKQADYSELLTKGLIRIGLPIPTGAQFTLAAVNDPYNFASASELSLFRRPLPSTSLPFQSTVMWDGRAMVGAANVHDGLVAQAINAIETHEQGSKTPSSTEVASAVAFESALFTAQASDDTAGQLNVAGATGGPQALSTTPFHIGINDVLGKDPTHAAFTPNVMTDYNAWANSTVGTPTQVAMRRVDFARRAHLQYPAISDRGCDRVQRYPGQ